MKTDDLTPPAPPGTNGHDQQPQVHCRIDVLPNGGGHIHLTLGQGPQAPYLGMITYQLADPSYGPTVAQKFAEWMVHQAQQAQQRLQVVTGSDAQKILTESRKSN